MPRSRLGPQNPPPLSSIRNLHRTHRLRRCTLDTYHTGTTVHADTLPRLRTLPKTTANRWDETPSFALCKHVPEHTKMSHLAKVAITSKLKYQITSKNAQLQRKYDAKGNSTFLDEITSDEIFATLPALTPADSIHVRAHLGRRNSLCTVP